MGSYDITKVVKNVFVGNRSLDRFPFLLNNIKFLFEIGGNKYDVITYQTMLQKERDCF